MKKVQEDEKEEKKRKRKKTKEVCLLIFPVILK
jgi:hypothetical protein